MADLGDISTDIQATDVFASYLVAIPVWPDISMAIPGDSGGSTTGGIPGSVTFS